MASGRHRSDQPVHAEGHPRHGLLQRLHRWQAVARRNRDIADSGSLFLAMALSSTNLLLINLTWKAHRYVPRQHKDASQTHKVCDRRLPISGRANVGLQFAVRSARRQTPKRKSACQLVVSHRLACQLVNFSQVGMPTCEFLTGWQADLCQPGEFLTTWHANL